MYVYPHTNPTKIKTYSLKSISPDPSESYFLNSCVNSFSLRRTCNDSKVFCSSPVCMRHVCQQICTITLST